MDTMTLNSTISNATRSAKVYFRDTITGKFLYTRLAINGSLTGVDTEKGFGRESGLTVNLIFM